MRMLWAGESKMSPVCSWMVDMMNLGRGEEEQLRVPANILSVSWRAAWRRDDAFRPFRAGASWSVKLTLLFNRGKTRTLTMSTKPPTISDPVEDDSDSSADSDFGGSLSPSSADESSASDTEGAKATKTKARKKRSIEDSGDEGIIKEGKKKRRKKGKAGHDAEEGTEESAIGMRVRDRKLGRAA